MAPPATGVTDNGDIVTDPGNLLIVSSGGITIGATAANGGTEEVLARGVASDTVIVGGTLELASGGSAGAGAITFSAPAPPPSPIMRLPTSAPGSRCSSCSARSFNPE